MTVSVRGWLEHRCRHHGQGDGPPYRRPIFGVCALGIDCASVARVIGPEAAKRIGAFPRAHPCVYGRREGLNCSRYEPYTAAEIVADEAATMEALRRVAAGRSPCCDAPVTKQESARTTVAVCSACGQMAWRACRPRDGAP